MVKHGIRERHQEKGRKHHQRDSVSEKGIYFLLFQLLAAGALLVLPAGWPLAGLGRVLGAGSPPLSGVPGLPT